MTTQSHCRLSNTVFEHLTSQGLDALPELLRVLRNTAMEAKTNNFLGQAATKG